MDELVDSYMPPNIVLRGIKGHSFIHQSSARANLSINASSPYIILSKTSHNCQAPIAHSVAHRT